MLESQNPETDAISASWQKLQGKVTSWLAHAALVVAFVAKRVQESGKEAGKKERSAARSLAVSTVARVQDCGAGEVYKILRIDAIGRIVPSVKDVGVRVLRDALACKELAPYDAETDCFGMPQEAKSALEVAIADKSACLANIADCKSWLDVLFDRKRKSSAKAVKAETESASATETESASKAPCDAQDLVSIFVEEVSAMTEENKAKVLQSIGAALSEPCIESVLQGFAARMESLASDTEDRTGSPIKPDHPASIGLATLVRHAADLGLQFRKRFGLVGKQPDTRKPHDTPITPAIIAAESARMESEMAISAG